jgi:interferon gamma-inducible protein 30
MKLNYISGILLLFLGSLWVTTSNVFNKKIKKHKKHEHKYLTKSPIKIEILIESLCKDCMSFFENSFKLFFQNTENNKLADVTFFPFGNADEKKEGDKWHFICQHGREECFGNVIQVCGLSKLKDQEEKYKFLICMYKESSLSSNHEENIKKCLTQDKYQSILLCAKGDEGNRLQHEVASKSKEHKHVPYVFINGIHSKENERRVIDNLLKFVCDQHSDKPESCKSLSNNEYSWDKFDYFIEKRCINKFYPYK